MPFFPDFADKAREAYSVWNFPDELLEGLLEGLGKAGLDPLR